MCHGQILGDAIRRARKPRKCQECGRIIAPGEKYRRYVYIESRGDPASETVTCPMCTALGHALIQEGSEACWYVGEIRSNLRDLIDGCAATARAVREAVKARLRDFA